MSDNEKVLDQRLAALGLPDDLAEVVLKDSPAPSAAGVERIKLMTLARAVSPEYPESAPAAVPAPPASRRFHFPVWAVAAALALAAITSTLVVGPDRVIAGVRQILSFVPGFGVRDAGEIRLASARPVRLDRNGQWVEIRGLVADAAGVIVHITSQGVPLPLEAVSVVNGGEALPMGGGSVVSSGSTTYDGWFSFRGQIPVGTRQITVVIRGAAEWQLPVALVPGEQLLPADQFGPTAQASGYTIAARAQALSDRTDISLLVRGEPQGARVMNLGRYSSLSILNRPITLESSGWATEATPTAGSRGEVWYLKSPNTPPEVSVATLTVPMLEVLEQGEANIQLKIAEGPVDKTLAAGRWSVRILRTELRDGRMRVHLDLGPAQRTYLSSFHLELKADVGEIYGHEGRVDEATGQVRWIEFALPEGAQKVTLKLLQVYVTVEGPWVVGVPIQR